MSHDHVSDDPELAKILRGDHFHDTPEMAAQQLVADWWAMVCARVPDGTHVVHLVPLDTEAEDDVVHVEVHKRRGRMRQPDNDMHNWLHVLPLYISVGHNDVLVSLTTHVMDKQTQEIQDQERIWLFLPEADIVEFNALEAEEFFEEQAAEYDAAQTQERTAEVIVVAEAVPEPLVLDAEAWEELRVAAAADDARRRVEASVIAQLEDQMADVPVPEELNGLFRDAWILDDFLATEAETGVRASRYEFNRYVGPLDLYEPPQLRDRPALTKTRKPGKG